MQRELDICKRCPHFVTHLGTIMYDGEPTMRWMASCEKCEREKPMHLCDFEQAEVMDNCQFYTEYFMRHLHSKEIK